MPAKLPSFGAPRLEASREWCHARSSAVGTTALLVIYFSDQALTMKNTPTFLGVKRFVLGA